MIILDRHKLISLIAELKLQSYAQSSANNGLQLGTFLRVYRHCAKVCPTLDLHEDLSFTMQIFFQSGLAVLNQIFHSLINSLMARNT